MSVLAAPVELTALRDEGYFVRRDLFTSAEMDVLERLADEAVRWRNERLHRYDDVYASVSVKDGITFVNQLTDDSAVRDDLVRFSTGPKLAAFARSIAGSGAAHYCYQIIYKHPRHDRPFPWHQDVNHTPSDPGFFNVWIALSDMTIGNGCLWVRPGEALDEVLPYHETPFGLSCWPLEGSDQGVPIEIERGSVFVITSMTLHKSGGNVTGGTRKAMLAAFMDAGATVHGKPVELTPYAKEARDG